MSRSARSAAWPSGSSPRYAARYREYRYTIWNGPRSPLRERTALGVREPLDVAAMAEPAQAFVGRHDFSAFGGGRPTTDPDRACGPGPQAGSDGHDRRGRRRLPAPDGPAASWRPSCASGRGGDHGRMSRRRSVAGDGRSPARSPRPGALPAAGRPSGDRRTRRRRRDTRNDDDEDLYTAGERDRATLVRRRRDGRDARPPRLAHRPHPRGQAQADLSPRTSTAATT